jgi:hypothetical protein
MKLRRDSSVDNTVVDASGSLIPRPPRSLEREVIARGVFGGLALTDSAVSDILKYLDSTLEVGESQGPGVEEGSSLNPLIERAFLDVIANTDLGNAELKERLFTAQLRLKEFRSSHILLAEFDSSVLCHPIVVQLSQTRSLPPRSWSAKYHRFFFGTLSMGSWIETPGAMTAESFHVILKAPQGFRVEDMTLDVNDGETLVISEADNDHQLSIGHAYVTVPSTLTSPEARCRMHFYSNKTGFFSESAAIAVVTSSLLGIFTYHFSTKNFNLITTGQHEQVVDANFAASLSLLLPAVAITIATQRDGHRLASMALATQRIFVLVVAVSAAAASLPIALQLSPVSARIWWFTAAVLCWLASLRVLSVSCLHAWKIRRPSASEGPSGSLVKAVGKALASARESIAAELGKNPRGGASTGPEA